MVKDRETAKQLISMLETAIEATRELYGYVQTKNSAAVDELAAQLAHFLQFIKETSVQFQNEDPKITLPDACATALDSLYRIYKLYYENWLISQQKIEFELIPILHIACLRFEYWSYIYPDEKNMKTFFKTRIPELAQNKYVLASSQTGNYKYDISIVIYAYNKIEYTKMCIQSLLAHLPSEINCELILINHGSQDETKEFFESIKPNKQLDILINGSVPGIETQITEGKYTLVVSNDILVTENAIRNLFRCINSDPQVAWVVPSTPNVSNLQSISAKYNTMTEMYQFAENNNQYDEKRHEQRVRLCDPIEIVRAEVHQRCLTEIYQELFFADTAISFPDDKVSLWFRRNKYKMILAKDAYCYHFGSATLKNEIQNQNEQLFYLNGRRHFLERFGVDPWGTGFCYSLDLINNLPCNETKNTNILGVNCGLGSNPLKVRELIREKTGNQNVTIYNCTTKREYLNDLEGVSDYVQLLQKYGEIKSIINKINFTYVIFEDWQQCPIDVAMNLIKRFKSHAYLCFKIYDPKSLNIFKAITSEVVTTSEWIIIEIKKYN